MEYFVIFIALVVVFGFAYSMHNWGGKTVDQIVEEQLQKIASKHPQVFKDDYSFYTDNHPQVWGKIDEPELIKQLHFCATGPKGIPIYNPVYCYQVDTINKRFYFVSGKAEFNFSTRMHYEQWIQGRSAVTDAIAKYREQ